MFTLDTLPWLPAAPQDFGARLSAARTAGLPHLASLAQFALNANQSTTLSKRLLEAYAAAGTNAPHLFRLGLLSNGTLGLTAAMLPAATERYGVASRSITVEYDRIVPAALGADADFKAFQPEAVLLAIDFEGLPWPALRPGTGTGQIVAEPLAYLSGLASGIRDAHGCPVIFQTVAEPPISLFGSFDRCVEGTMRRAVLELNEGIAELASKSGNLLLDVANLAARVGRDRWFDYTQWYANKLPFALSNGPIYADHVARLIAAMRGKSRKCLVLDLDNTVWGGVVGDDGVAGLKISSGDADGEAHLAIQRHALALKDRGIILAVCSKNNFETAVKPFREHPEMLLKESDIAVFQANWIDKATNLEAIAKALNIGIDALVLLDDNPAERAQVRAALPMVGVPELPNDPSQFVWCLSAGGYFEAVAFSDEDRLRAESYASDAQRVSVMQQTRNLEDYLTQLGMTMNVRGFDELGRQRIAQLINKSNQFNLTTRRYTEVEVEGLANDPLTYTMQARLKDRFGDLGMIGVMIAKPEAGKEHEIWNIDTWLMSCRVLGRKVEEAMLSELIRSAQSRGVKTLVGRYLPTSKNGIVKEHYAKLGFALADGDIEGPSTWRLDIASYNAPALPMSIQRE